MFYHYQDGSIVGAFTLPQPGIETVELPADHADVLAFYNPPVDLVAYAAEKRWEREVGGTVWNDWPVHTDRESQSKIVAERLAIEAGVRDDPDAWKFADGEFRMVSNEDFIALTNAVRNHVRQCFAIEATVLVGIAAEQITTTEQIDTAFD